MLLQWALKPMSLAVFPFLSSLTALKDILGHMGFSVSDYIASRRSCSTSRNDQKSHIYQNCDCDGIYESMRNGTYMK